MKDVFTLLPYQERAVAEIDNRRSVLFLPYGAGKTVIGLTYAVNRYEKHAITQGKKYHNLVAIVFCPNENMTTWEVEMDKWFPNVGLFIDKDGLDDAIEDIAKDQLASYSVLIYPYHLIASNHDKLAKFIRDTFPGTILADESTEFKNIKTKKTDAVLKLSAIALKAGITCIPLTGNLTPETPINIWSQFQFTYGDKNPFGKTYYAFLRKWFLKTDYTYQLKFELIDQFYRIRDYYSITLSDLEQQQLDDFKKIKRINYSIEYYQPSEVQETLTKHLKKHWSLPRHLKVTRKDKKQTIVNPNDCEQVEFNHTISIIHKQLQISAGFYYGNDYDDLNISKRYTEWIPFASSKYDLLEYILTLLYRENPDRKVIIWCFYVAERRGILTTLDKLGLISTEGPRSEARQKFQSDPQTKIIIMPATKSRGFNELVVADTNIFFSPSLSQEKHEQAKKRIDRPGQEAQILNNIYMCARGCVDEAVVHALQAKDLTGDSLDAIINKFAPAKEDNVE